MRLRSTVTNSQRVRQKQDTGASIPRERLLSPTFHNTLSPKNPGASNTNASTLPARAIKGDRTAVPGPMDARVRICLRLSSKTCWKNRCPACNWLIRPVSGLSSWGLKITRCFQLLSPAIHAMSVVTYLSMPSTAQLAAQWFRMCRECTLCTRNSGPARKSGMCPLSSTPALHRISSGSYSSSSRGELIAPMGTGLCRLVFTWPLVMQKMVSTISPTENTMSAASMMREAAK
mmetsp:Transcript_16708/g.42497  ORF Transcript_16708/g.42497 Transcript_16708/m.42497 type:complete len:232 (-) Transcript_16708:1925-2620(-)